VINASKQMDRMRNPGLNLDLMSPIDLQEGVARLSRGAYFKEAPLEMTLSILTESAAQMSGVERVSIWALTEHQRELRCLDLYELSTRRHSSGVCLSASDYPAYFRALREEGCIVADDAALHPSTSEFARGYLGPHQITAMLDTPIHIRGDLEGRILHRAGWYARAVDYNPSIVCPCCCQSCDPGAGRVRSRRG
jgi:hypothetical protein